LSRGEKKYFFANFYFVRYNAFITYKIFGGFFMGLSSKEGKRPGGKDKDFRIKSSQGLKDTFLQQAEAEAREIGVWDKALIPSRDGQKRFLCRIQFGSAGVVYGYIDRVGGRWEKSGERVRIGYKLQSKGARDESTDPDLYHALEDLAALNRERLSGKNSAAVIQHLGIDPSTCPFDFDTCCQEYPQFGFDVQYLEIWKPEIKTGVLTPIASGYEAYTVAHSFQDCCQDLSIKPLDVNNIPELLETLRTKRITKKQPK
jgi:hypothetical protein